MYNVHIIHYNVALFQCNVQHTHILSLLADNQEFNEAPRNPRLYTFSFNTTHSGELHFA